MDVWQTVVVGGFTLAGAFGGALLSQRSSERLLAAQMRDSHRNRLHELVADVIADAQAVVDQGWIMIPMFARFRDADLTEFVDTDTGRETRERSARLTSNQVRLKLLVADQPLQHAVDDLVQNLDDWADEANGPVLMRSTNGLSEK